MNRASTKRVLRYGAIDHWYRQVILIGGELAGYVEEHADGTARAWTRHDKPAGFKFPSFERAINWLRKADDLYHR